MLARAYSMRGDLLKVEECYQATLKICNEIGDERYRYFSIGPLRQIHLLHGEFHLAEKYALMEQTFYRKSGSKKYIAENLINLGDVLITVSFGLLSGITMKNESESEAERAYNKMHDLLKYLN